MLDPEKILHSSKIVIAVAVAAIGLSNIPRILLERFEVSSRSARIITFFLAIEILVFLPSSLPIQCEYRNTYQSRCILYACVAAVFFVIAALIHYRYAYTQWAVHGRAEKPHTIIGGRKLTFEAAQLKRAGQSEQQIFKEFEYKPDRMWERDLISNMQLPYDIATILAATFIIMGLLCAASWAVLEAYANEKHVPLDFTVSHKAQEMIEIQSPLPVALDSNISACDIPIHWSIKALNGESGPEVIGQILDKSRTSIFYKPPVMISQDVTVSVSAAIDHPAESKSVLVHLKPSPQGVVHSPVNVALSDSSEMYFDALILNSDYTFTRGEYTLRNADIPSAVRQWVNDKLFDEFDIVIPVGAASREHHMTTDEQERDRSHKRAEMIATELQLDLPGQKKKIWGLNVGRFQSEEPALDTDIERQVVIIGIKGDHSKAQTLEGIKKAVRENDRNYDIFKRYQTWYLPEKWELVDPSTFSLIPEHASSAH